MAKEPKAIKQARLPKGAYKTDLATVISPFMKKNMADLKKFQIVKKPDDKTYGTKVLRLNIGGNASKGYYIWYRGDLGEVRELLGSAFRAMSVMNTEPPITDDTK